MTTQSTTPKAAEKAAILAKAREYKLRERLPLLVHASGTWGRWARKVNGKLRYFGPVVPGAKDFGASKAMALYQGQRVDLEAGRTPRPKIDAVTVADLCDAFLISKDDALARGEIVGRTRIDYERTTDRIVECFGKDRPVDDLCGDDFAKLRKHLAKTLGPVALGNAIQRVRTVFKYAHESKWLKGPMLFGPGFRRPSKKVLRQQRNRAGKKMFEPEEIHLLLSAAGLQMKAMILLAANSGFGNADVGLLPLKALDLKGGWVTFPRPKTAVPRRCPLWPETIAALEAYLAKRPKPKDRKLAGRVFITKYGGSWYKDVHDNPLSAEFSKLLKGIDTSRAEEARKKRRRAPEPLQRPGRGFYCLRHGFQTAGDGAKDPIATKYIMGHAPESSDMSAVYREGVDDDRLLAVTEHVRRWLFGEQDCSENASCNLQTV